jgi:hypothetical protein
LTAKPRPNRPPLLASPRGLDLDLTRLCLPASSRAQAVCALRACLSQFPLRRIWLRLLAMLLWDLPDAIAMTAKTTVAISSLGELLESKYANVILFNQNGSSNSTLRRTVRVDRKHRGINVFFTSPLSYPALNDSCVPIDRRTNTNIQTEAR